MVMTASLLGQNSIGIQMLPTKTAKYDLVIYGGVGAKIMNLNTYNSYDGVFADYIFSQSQNQQTTYGIWASANDSRFVDNMERYSGKGLSLGFGNIFGYYSPSFSRLYDSFTGISLGFMYSLNKGASSTKVGNYRGRQEDVLVCGSLNFNLLKRVGNYFPRFQVQLGVQKPLLTKQEAYWNNEQLADNPWNMTYYQATAKGSLVNWYVHKTSYLSPKILGTYSYAVGNKKGEYGLGVEMSIHQWGEDDFASVYYLYKWSKQFSFGVSVNISGLY